MKLMNFAFENPFQWTGDNICTLVIENPAFYRKTMFELLAQTSGQDGSFVLSEAGDILDIGKSVEVISDVFTADPAQNRRILSGVQKEAGELALHDMQSESMELFSLVNQVLSEIVFQTGLDLRFDEISEMTGLLKMLNLRPDTVDLTLPERLLLYMEMCTHFLKKRLFVIVNLRACMTKDELRKFFRDALYRKFSILTIESQSYGSFPFETVKIIDEDLCEI